MNFEYYIGLSYNERIELVKKPFYEIFYNRSGSMYSNNFIKDRYINIDNLNIIATYFDVEFLTIEVMI